MEKKEWSNTPEDFPKFLSVDSSVIDKMINDIIPKMLQDIASVLGIDDGSEIIVDYNTMSEIISRVEKRRVYFYIYYEGVEMGELNEASLICFWILKLMPFKHEKVSSSTLNSRIAYTFFLKILFYVANVKGKEVNVRDAVLDQLLYAFKYRDLSKEAIMALAESLLS